ncbi:MAG: SusD/RagB family nutrient-binding outer membrane lipoprotein [Saprospiraceae bacterium]|nr:SusD/RagB family nutrient-binding outer membrane lipoprotein [Saprospiraceae bacterium]
MTAKFAFWLPKGIERGWSIGGTSEDWYNKAIIASFEEWGIMDVQMAEDYLKQTEVNYATAAGDWNQKIGVQKWLSLFMQGFQAWTEWRRLDFQKLEAPVDGAIGEIGMHPAPLRLVYPSAEQTLNARNYFKALDLLKGEDKLSTRVWWDVK